MKTTNKNRDQMQQLVLLSLLTATVAVLGFISQFIAPTGTPMNFALIPVVLGAALCGFWAGAWLGGVSGLLILVTGQANFFLPYSFIGTIVIVMLKGILSGLCAGLVYKLLERVNRYLAVIASAIVCPLVNTGIFLIGCFTFFWDYMVQEGATGGLSPFAYAVETITMVNFVVELAANIALSPVILRLINIKKKK